MTTYVTDPAAEAAEAALLSSLDPQARRNRLFDTHQEMADKIARKKHGSMPKCVSYDELRSAAYFGLLNACDKYDPTQHSHFRMYARVRILGEISDWLRGCGHGTRNRQIYGWSLEVPVYGTQSRRPLPLEESLAQDPEEGDFAEFFNELVRCLPSEIQRIFRLYYIDNLTMKEIAEIVGRGESRVSQLMSYYRDYLRQRWNSQRCDLWKSVRPRHPQETYRLTGPLKRQSEARISA